MNETLTCNSNDELNFDLYLERKKNDYFLQKKTPRFQKLNNYSNDYSIKEQISSNLTSYIKYINPHLFNNNNNKIIRISRNSLKENFNNKEKVNTIDNYFHTDKEYKKEINEKIQFSYINYKAFEIQKQNSNLILPLKYKRLYRSFKELEFTINHFKIMKSDKTININRISNSIESSYKHRFNLKIFQQILFLVPNFYIIKWIKNNENNDYELLVDVPKNFEINIKNETKKYILYLRNNFIPDYKQLSNNLLIKRKKIFKEKLIEKVNEQHNKFLIENKIENYNPYLKGTWHKKFDLENIKDIPKYKIEPKPININYYQNCIINNDIRTKLIEEALCDNNIDINELRSSNLEQYCSKEFIIKLRKKEKAIKISNKQLKISEIFHQQQDLVKNICNLISQIKILSLIHKKESWLLFDLSSKLLNIKSINKIFTKQSLIKNIKKLSFLFPNFIKIINHSNFGLIILIDIKLELRKEIFPNIKKEDFSI